MVRKKYFIPFIIILVLVSLFKVFFLDNILKISLEKSISAIPQIDCKIDKLKLKIIKGEINLKDVIIVLEGKDDAILVSNALIELNNSQLLRGRLVINNMQVLGIEVVDKELVIWEKVKKKDSIAKVATKKATKSILSYYSADNLAQRLEIDKLLDVNKASFLKVVEQEYLQLVSSYNEMQNVLTSDDLDKSFKELEQAYKELESKRPNDWTQLPSYLQELASLKQQYDRVKLAYDNKQSAINRFQVKVNNSIKKVQDAGNVDMRIIDEKIKFMNTKQQTAMSDLIGAEVREYVDLTRKSIDVLKSFKKEKKKTTLFKGVDMQFPLKDNYPVFYIEKVKIEGVDKKKNKFSGVASDITHKQELRNIPARVELFQNLGATVSFLGVTVDLRDNLTVIASGFMNNHALSSAYWDVQNIPLDIVAGKYNVDFLLGYEEDVFSALIKVKTTDLKLALNKTIDKKNWIERYLFESLSKMPYFSFNLDLKGDKVLVESNIEKVLDIASQSLVNKEIDKMKEIYVNDWNSFVKEQEIKIKEDISKLAF